MSDVPKTRAAPKHVVILCHPEEESFNMAVARRYCDAVARIGD